MQRYDFYNPHKFFIVKFHNPHKFFIAKFHNPHKFSKKAEGRIGDFYRWIFNLERPQIKRNKQHVFILAKADLWEIVLFFFISKKIRIFAKDIIIESISQQTHSHTTSTKNHHLSHLFFQENIIQQTITYSQAGLAEFCLSTEWIIIELHHFYNEKSSTTPCSHVVHLGC